MGPSENQREEPNSAFPKMKSTPRAPTIARYKKLLNAPPIAVVDHRRDYQNYKSDSRENDLFKHCVGFYQFDVASDRGTDHGHAEDS